jgi:peptide/nickel transport system ATP-binding protein
MAMAFVFHLCDIVFVTSTSHMEYARRVRVVGLRCETRSRVLLADVGFAVAVGAPLALLGPSGAGKSMVLRCLLGLAPAEMRVTGRVLFNKEEEEEDAVELAQTTAIAARRGRGLTLLPQAAGASLDPVRTVGRQVSEVLEIHGNGEDTIAGLLALVGLAEATARQVPLALSGGQAQRVALALALACRPAVLLADEPTASLDNVAQAAMLGVLAETCAARRIALVLVTHDVAVAMRVCREVVILEDGRVVEAGDIDEVVARPVHATTRALVAAARRVEALWGSHG